jgi:oxygen-independent coproporphyrinogen-3 oxidase
MAGRQGGERIVDAGAGAGNSESGILNSELPVSLGLYLHIPFCQAICSYCNFNRGLFDGDLKRRYVDALEHEIRATGLRLPAADAPAASGPQPAADTIFFGGGTPSLLEPAEVAQLIEACRDAYALDPQAEITLETNPETATGDRLEAFRRAGVTRLSFGVQSFDDAELARLGRIHSAARAKDAVRAAKAAGFRDVSFDLMFWLPGQSLSSWLATIDQAIALEPDHLSLYLLELYPNAPLRESMARSARGRREDSEAAPAAGAGVGPRANEVMLAGATARGGGAPRALSKDDWLQSTDDEAADMYLEALARLDAAGFGQYEISNVARPGHASRHNLKYWQQGSWRGFGCGAHSTVADARWKNVSGTADYIGRVSAGAGLRTDVQILTPQERFEECLFTGLRLSAGVSRREIAVRYGTDPWDRYGETLSPCVEEDLMWAKGDRFGLTRRGMLVANEILTAFV